MFGWSPFGSIPPRLQQRQSVVRALVEAFPSDLKLLSNPCSWKFACALTNVTIKISNAMQNHPPPKHYKISNSMTSELESNMSVDARSDAKNASMATPRPRCQSWDESAPQCLVHAHCCLKQIIGSNHSKHIPLQRGLTGDPCKSRQTKNVCKRKIELLGYYRKPVQSAENGTSHGTW